jgi:hypothetical protein
VLTVLGEDLSAQGANTGTANAVNLPATDSSGQFSRSKRQKTYEHSTYCDDDCTASNANPKAGNTTCCRVKSAAALKRRQRRCCETVDVGCQCITDESAASNGRAKTAAAANGAACAG